tara:strand:+ start:3935 stop:4393 length:459 start_codon:yes stop_codon:yes gene_type:complete
MNKLGLVLGMALVFTGCQKEEIETEVVETQNLIEVMENNRLYERVSDSIESGLHIKRGQRISQVFKSNSEDCFIDKDLDVTAFNLITSDDNTYSYRITTVTGNTYQYAFRTQDVDNFLKLSIYNYDIPTETHTLVFEERYEVKSDEFNMCED